MFNVAPLGFVILGESAAEDKDARKKGETENGRAIVFMLFLRNRENEFSKLWLAAATAKRLILCKTV